MSGAVVVRVGGMVLGGAAWRGRFGGVVGARGAGCVEGMRRLGGRVRKKWAGCGGVGWWGAVGRGGGSEVRVMVQEEVERSCKAPACGGWRGAGGVELETWLRARCAIFGLASASKGLGSTNGLGPDTSSA